MSTAKISDIILAIPSLAKNRSNWSIFKMRFRLTLTPYGLYHHVIPDNKNVKPVDPLSSVAAGTTLTADQKKVKEQYEGDLAKWERNSDMARYILSRVIPDSMLQKVYSDTRSVKEMWDMLTTEFESKTSLVQADLHTKFHSYRCPDKGDIRIHLNCLRQMHQDLQNIGVLIKDKDYATIIMQSLPSSYMDFVANIAAAAQLVMVDLTTDKLQHQLEQEFDRRKTHRVPNTPKSEDAAYSSHPTDSSEPQNSPSRRRGSRSELRCWNCDGIGHMKSECPSPLMENG